MPARAKQACPCKFSALRCPIDLSTSGEVFFCFKPYLCSPTLTVRFLYPNTHPLAKCNHCYDHHIRISPSAHLSTPKTAAISNYKNHTIRAPVNSLHVACVQMSVELIPYEELTWGRFLGRGAEGAVYAAWYLETPVAVKRPESKIEVEMNLHSGTSQQLCS